MFTIYQLNQLAQDFASTVWPSVLILGKSRLNPGESRSTERRPLAPWSPRRRMSRMKNIHEDKGFSILPSGKRLHNYGKSPFFMGKLTINGDVL
jgi:hypothetical protein